MGERRRARTGEHNARQVEDILFKFAERKWVAGAGLQLQAYRHPSPVRPGKRVTQAFLAMCWVLLLRCPQMLRLFLFRPWRAVLGVGVLEISQQEEQQGPLPATQLSRATRPLCAGVRCARRVRAGCEKGLGNQIASSFIDGFYEAKMFATLVSLVLKTVLGDLDYIPFDPKVYPTAVCTDGSQAG